MKKLIFLCLPFLLTSCYGKYNANLYKQQPLGHFKVGSSYTINNVTYHPRHYDHYDEVGIASWYGKNNHKKLTANGEIFNCKAISAAHKTLPLPSFVEVTNLENGRKLVVKVNDRGPFVANRIIDLSEKAAMILGFHHQGLAKVRVRYLKNKSKKFISTHTHYKHQYQKVMASYSRSSVTSVVPEYVAKFKTVHEAKSVASKLRMQGLKKVRFTFFNGEYYVHIR